MREVSMTNYNLQRFLDAQRGDYEQALAEVRNGRKYSHWIWYIFPQLKGLGMSYNSQYYGLSGKEEAEAYLAHPILGERLREITSVFNEVASDDLFQQVIDHYFQGKVDETTKRKLE